MSVRKRRKKNYSKLVLYVLAGSIFLIVLYCTYYIVSDSEKSGENTINGGILEDQIAIDYPDEPDYPHIEYPENTGDIKPFGEDIVSKSGVLVDVTDNKIVAGRNAEKKIYPASMTKVMTLIIAVENMESPDDTFTMTHELIAPLIDAEASRAGFEVGETVTVMDMIYGAVLPSGADATVGLAVKLCGSEEEFVKLMNEKAEYMGLKNTHFCNTSGLHDENHYSTPVEMAMIMEYAMQNELCREVLSTYQYTTSSTPKHPKGIPLESTMFGRMYGDEVVGAQIEGGKTGYTDEAEHCLVTFGKKGGKEYVTVTSLTSDAWSSIYDAFDIYANYIEPKTEIVITPE